MTNDTAIRTPTLMFVGGEWTAGAGATMDVINPATGETVATVPAAALADVDAAIAAADAGFRQWRSLDAWNRSATLRKMAAWIAEHRDQIAMTITEEQGKPLDQAAGEVSATIDQFDWYADEARRIYGRTVPGHSNDHRIMVIRQPIGPVAAFAPSNFPALLPARKVAAALAAGCSVVLKPAETTPRTGYWLAAAAEHAGLPAGALNVITGDPAMISERLVTSPVIRKISITGSVAVGKHVLALAAQHVKPVSLELGGHAPVLVLDDADVDTVAEVTAVGKFRNAGQVCIAASRFLVDESIADQFVKTFVARAERLIVGDGRRPGVDMGPLESQRHVDATTALVADAVGRGASVAHGGGTPAGFDRGYWFEPTVLCGVDDEMDVMRIEPFGPIAPISPFSDLDDAIARANSTPYGLAGFVFTRDLRRAFEVSEALDVGMVGVNKLTVATAEAPFGGIKESGSGREGGLEGIDAYTTVKYINLAL